MALPAASARFPIEGVELAYPATFRDGQSTTAMFVVPAEPVAHRIADSGFTPAQVLPGRTVVVLACVHYTDTDCGAYEEIALSCLVEPLEAPQRGPVGTIRALLDGAAPTYTWHLGVTTELSRQAGLQMWGFPKVLADIAYERDEHEARFTWREAGQLVLSWTMPTRGDRRTPPIAPPTYSVLDGQRVVGHLDQQYKDVGIVPFGGALELGRAPLADELRDLGLGRRPVAAIWNGHLYFTMSAPTPLPTR